MRYFSLLFIFSLFVGQSVFSVSPVLASTSDPYADILISNSPSNLLGPERTIGAPDGVSASFLGKDVSLVLDMGQGEEGTGDLTLHMQLLNYGATATISFLDENQQVITSTNHLFAIGEATPTIVYNNTEPYRYVKIYTTEEEEWNLDAIETTAYEGQEEINETEEVEDVPQEETMTDSENRDTEEDTEVANHGLLITLPDDGNPETTIDGPVYFVGTEGTRHAFPSEDVFYSWYQNFDDLTYVNEDLLADYPLGKNVTVRPGTSLIKLQTDPKVYAIEPGGILRWITTEDLATSLYGEKWNERVIDVPDVFFGNYSVGDPIENEIHPDGSVGVSLSTGEIFYIQNTSRYHLPSDMVNTMRFNSDFYVPISDDLMELYIDAGDLEEDTTIQWPY